MSDPDSEATPPAAEGLAAPAATVAQVAVVGGTGPLGRGLAYRFARGGRRVVLGSRSPERASATATEIGDRLVEEGRAGASVGAATNAEAVLEADVVVLAVPYEGHDVLVEELAPRLAGRVVVSCVNPLGFDAQGPYGMSMQRSAAETAAALAPAARLVGAFHHVAARSLWGRADVLEHEDVLVCGDDEEAARVVAELARTVTGHDGVVVGPLRLARQLEPLTAVLISVNRRYRVRSGVALSGLGDRGARGR